MKAIFEKIELDTKSSFHYRSFDVPVFESSFHFHPEYELTYIRSGEGQRYVGASVADFESEDLILLGSNLPHCWISKCRPGGELVSATVVQFQPDFMGQDFLNLPETINIKALLENSKSGLRVMGTTRLKVLAEMDRMSTENSYDRLLSLLKILGFLAESADVQLIDMSFSNLKTSNSETLRFQNVFGYLIEHYREEISLQKIAEVANLSPTSFCRYFKSVTNKTFSEIVNAYRIQYACHLLRKDNLTISQIAFESGFNDVPYFNKLFKKLKGVNPSAFKV